ncbi:MAG: VCBS repeat-containing protein [Myxococcota bacterium]
MRIRGGLAALGCLLAVTGCSDLTVPASADIECQDAGQCPDGFMCNQATNRCQRELTNSTPLVSLDILPASPRWLQGVQVQAVISDADGDRVDLDLQFALGDGEPCPASTATPLTGLASSPTGEATTFTWTALDDAQGAQNCGLSVANVLVPSTTAAGARGPCDDPALTQPETDDDELVVGCVLVLEDLRLLATPTDVSTTPLSGAAAEDRDVVGDQPPIVAPVLDQTEYSFIVPIEFFVLDQVTAGGVGTDIVDVEVEFSIDNGVNWSLAAIEGPTRNLPSVARNPSDSDDVYTPADASVTPFIVIWNATAAPPADDTTEGGIGTTIRNVLIRTRGRSTFGDNVVVGPWVLSDSIFVENQTPPVVSDLQVLNRGSETYSGALHFSYALVDGEGDTVDVRFEYSVDNGATFLRATEWPWLLSEGSYNLQSAPSDLTLGGGLAHRFSWDIAADITLARDDVLIRAQAADDFSTGPPTFLALESEIGPLSTVSLNLNLCNDDQFMTSSTDATVELINADGEAGDDLLVFDPGGTRILARARSVIDSPDVFENAVTLPAEAAGPSVAAGPLFESGDDLVARTDSTTLNILSFDAVAGNYVARTPPITASSTRGLAPVIADINGDGANDIVEATTDGLLVHINPMDGTTGFSTTTVSLGATVIGFAAGELTGDTLEDIAVLVRGGPATNNSLSPASLLVVSGADLAGTPESVADGLDYLFIESAPLDQQHQNILLAVEDANGDSADEILVVEALSGDEAIAGFYSRGVDGWTLVGFFEDAIPARPRRLRFADVNADDAPDILVFLPGDSVAVYVGVAGGAINFVQSDAITLEGLDVAAADLNGDGTIDFPIVNLTPGPSGVQVCLTPETGSPPEELYSDTSDEDLEEAPDVLSVIDFDGDGIADVLVTESQLYRAFAGERRDAVGLGDLTLAAFPEPLADGDIAVDARTLVGDFNGDTVLDLFVHDTSSSDNYFIPGLSEDGQLAFAGSMFVGAVAGAPELAGDFDGDGLDELAFFSGSNIRVFAGTANLPSGGFTERQSLSATGSVDQLHSVDMNGDGLSDLVVRAGDDIDVFFGQSGSSDPLTSSPIGRTESSTLVASIAGDFDQDGAGELIATFGGGSRRMVEYRVNDSGTGLTTSTILPVASQLPTGLQSLVAVDYNGDGALDILAGSDLGLAVFGARLFGGVPNGLLPAVSFPSFSPVAIGVGDIHLDGVPDLIVADGEDLTVGVGQRLSARSGWTEFFVQDDILGTAVTLGIDRFNESVRFPVSRRRTVGRSLNPQSADDLRSDFPSRLRRSGLAGLGDPSALTPVTPAYEFRGDTTVRPVPMESGEDRLELINRYGALSAVTGDAMRVALPITGDLAGAVAVRVFLYERQWLTAADVSDDPFNAAPNAAVLLAFRDDESIAKERGVWRELPSSGPTAFSVDAENQQILVPLTRFGTVQAYVQR